VTARERPVVDFDHHSERYAIEGVAIERGMRAECPVAWSPHYGGFWVVSSHEDVSACLRDFETFSSDKTIDADGNAEGGLMIPTTGAFRAVPDDTDPPEWNHYRRLLNPPFAPSAIAQLEPRVLAFTTEAIDGVIETGSVDLILDIANPVTALTTLHILGLPREDVGFYSEPIHRLMYEPLAPETTAGMAAVNERLAHTVLERRAKPHNGLLDYLIAARIEGQPIDDRTLVDILVQLLMGGLDTTSGLLGNVFVYLDDHRDDHQRLLKDDEFLQMATEEFVRWVSPVTGLARTARKRAELGGQVIEAGDRILFLYRSANRDEEVFDQPDDVILDRFPNRHAGFGVGIHRCLGSNLARLVFRTVLRQVLTRMPDYRVDRERARSFPFKPANNGWVTIPASFTPGARLGATR
jgi:cytochrome P450